MSEWQPIETAPKFKSVLVCGNDQGVREYGRHMLIASRLDHRWVGSAMEDANYDIAPTLTHLTHWRPLPEFPE